MKKERAGLEAEVNLLRLQLNQVKVQSFYLFSYRFHNAMQVKALASLNSTALL